MSNPTISPSTAAGLNPSQLAAAHAEMWQRICSDPRVTHLQIDPHFSDGELDHAMAIEAAFRAHEDAARSAEVPSNAPDVPTTDVRRHRIFLCSYGQNDAAAPPLAAAPPTAAAPTTATDMQTTPRARPRAQPLPRHCLPQFSTASFPAAPQPQAASVDARVGIERSSDEKDESARNGVEQDT
ncbi:hypothetical protein R3P38DRAFT_2765758 [Favolaschia claudopus]|uniref:Uncharacterized protein n=1 Tax=Favolaschia claudopus TaxID=2862362 RepID=A0AAW0D753_9AGAR